MAEVTDGKTGKYRLSSTGTNYNFDPVEKAGAWHVPIALGGGNKGGSEMEVPSARSNLPSQLRRPSVVIVLAKACTVIALPPR